MRTKWRSWLLLAAPYLLCALFPIISVLFLEDTVLTNYQDKIVAEQQNSLQSAFNGMVQKVNNIENLSSMLSGNTLVEQYSYACLKHSGHRTIDRMALRDLLAGAKTDSLIYEIYLHDPLDNGVVSSNVAVSQMPAFYRFNYVVKGYSLEERVSRLAELPRIHKYCPAITLFLSETQGVTKEIVEYRLFLPVGMIRENQTQMVIALDAGELFREFRSALDSDGEFYVYDSTGTLIYSQGDRYEDLLPLSDSMALHPIETDTGTVYSAVLRSRDGRWTVKVCAPTLLGSGNVSILSPAFALFVILPMIACVLLTIAFTHKNYRGILEILNLFRGHAGEHPQEPEILGYRLVQQYAGRVIAEKDRMTQQINRYSDSRKYETLDKLIRNTYSGREEAARALAETDLVIRDGRNAVLCICCPEASYTAVVSDGITVRQTVRQVIDDLLEQPYVLFDTAPNETTCVISLEEEDSLELLVQDIVSRLNVELTYRYGIEVSIGAGSEVPSVYLLHTSYTQARQVLRYSEAYGNKVTLYADLVQLEDVYYYPRECDEKICDYVVAGKKEEAKRIIQQVFEENFERNSRILSAGAIEKLKNRLWSSLSALAEKYGISSEELKQRVTELSGKDGSIKGWFDSAVCAIDCLDEVISEKRNKSQNKTIDRIVEYVNENLCDNTLSLVRIADALGLHRSYLSNIFKNTYGENLSAYIERLRIEKARDMIKNTDMKIWDIAEAVGYTSDASFRRAFKRITGITPGEYREQ